MINKNIGLKVKKPNFYSNVENGRVEHGAIVELAFSNKGTQFVSGDLDGTVKVNLSKATAFKMVLELTKALESLQEIGTRGVDEAIKELTVVLSKEKFERKKKKTGNKK